MKTKIIFKNKKPLIGMIHLAPLSGFRGYKGMKVILRKALKDLKRLEKAGFDGALIENIDYPCFIGAPAKVIETMDKVTKYILAKAKIPIGVEIIYDMPATVKLASKIGCHFIRLDVFADPVVTRWGEIPASYQEVKAILKKSKHKPLLYTDVHVKHAKLLSKSNLAESIKKSLTYGSDGIIITGSWTGIEPKIDDLKLANKIIRGKAPVIIGSGLNLNNAKRLMPLADMAIVGTAIKINEELNQPIDFNKTKKLVNVIQEL